MQLQRNQDNVLVFLLVQDSDPRVTVDPDLGTLEVSYSIDGGPFVPYSGQVTRIGFGWHSVTVNPGDGAILVLRAKGEGTAEWRDIHEIMNPAQAQPVDLSPVLEAIEGFSSGLGKEMLETQRRVDALAEVIDALLAAQGKNGVTLDRLTKLKIVPDQDRPMDRLVGEWIQTEKPYMSHGLLVSQASPFELLGPGEKLGASILPFGDWGRYDSSASSAVLEEDVQTIRIAYGQDGDNQQVWKVFALEEPGDFILDVTITAKNGGDVLFNVRQHRSPYRFLGFSNFQVMTPLGQPIRIVRRVSLAPINPGETARFQIVVANLHGPEEVYAFENLSLKRIVHD